MLTANTVTKLQEMHLSAMAKAFKDQMTDPNMADMSFEDRFGLIVDHEWTTRKNNHLFIVVPYDVLRKCRITIQMDERLAYAYPCEAHPEGSIDNPESICRGVATDVNGTSLDINIIFSIFHHFV